MYTLGRCITGMVSPLYSVSMCKEKCAGSVDEALNLRSVGIQKDILILGYTPEVHFHYLIEENLTQNFLSLEYSTKLNIPADELKRKVYDMIPDDYKVFDYYNDGDVYRVWDEYKSRL